MESSVDEKGAEGRKKSPASTISNSALLGEIVWLWSHSKLHREWSISSIHQWILPALLHNQFRIYRRDGKPRGFVSWAKMSTEVEEAYVLNTATLKPNDWVSGDKGWIIDYVAPFGDAKDIAHDLKYHVFANDMGRFLRTKPGSDTMNIRYLHGAKVAEQARDWKNNPTVNLGAS